MRALFFEFPDDDAVWDFPEQYFLGDDLLVAPVVEPGRDGRQPSTCRAATGSTRGRAKVRRAGDRRACAPLDRIPIFATARARSALARVFSDDRREAG